MLAALIPQLIPILGMAIDKGVPDNVSKEVLRQEMEKALVDNANSINLETIKTNQIEAASKHWFTASWRPAIGWSCALGIFWLFIGAPMATWVTSMAGVEMQVPTVPTDLLLELTFAMLGMAGLRTFEKMKGLTR